jgi:hypothetical protein
MANINVRKKKKPVGPWIFTLLLLALVAFGAILLFNRRGNSFEDKVSGVKDDYETQKKRVEKKIEPYREKMSDKMDQGKEKMKSRDQQDKNQPQEVKNFVAFAEDSTPQAGKEHLYTYEGLNQMADALEKVQEQKNLTGENISSSINDLKSKARKLKTDSSGAAVKNAFRSATVALENIQKEGFPENRDQIESLKETAGKISGNKVVGNQTDVVQDFMNESAETVEEFASAK